MRNINKWDLIKRPEEINREIRGTETRRHAFIKYAGDSILIMDNELRITDANDSACALLGYTNAELTSMKISELLPEHELENYHSKLGILKITGGSMHERRFRRKDGSETETEVNVRLLKGVGYIAVIRDITERKKAEKALREREAQLTSLFENMEGAISLIDREKRYVLFNKQFIYDINYISGQDPHIGKKVWDYLPPEELEKWYQFLDGVLKGEKKVVEVDFMQDGKRICYRSSFTPVITDGEVTGVTTYSIDLTKSKEAEEKIKEREAQLTTLFENIEGATSLLDTDKKYVLFNNRFICDYKLLTGRVPEIGWEVYDFFPEETKKERLKIVESALKGNKEVVEVDYIRDGKHVYYRTSFNPVITDGKVTGVSTYSLDISKSKEAEMKIRESEEKFRLSFMTSQDAFYIGTLNEGRIIDANDSFYEMCGYTREEAIGKTTRELNLYVHPEDRAKMLAGLSANGHLKDLELTCRKKNGELFLVSSTVNVWQMNNEPVIMAMIRDITERKKAEKKLKVFEHFFNNTNDLACIANLEGYYEEVNPQFAKLLGYSEKELIEGGFLSIVHPDDIPAAVQAVEKLNAGAPAINMICRHRKKNGDYLWVEWNTTPDPVTGKLYGVGRDITEKKRIEQELIKSEERHRALVENITDAIVLMDANSQVIYQSPSAERITGYSFEDRTKGQPYELVYKQDQLKIIEIVQRSIREPGVPISYQIRINHKDGRIIWIEAIILNLLHNESVKALVVSYRDVTERIKMEKALVQSEEKHRALTENISDAIMLLDENFENIYQSPSVERIVGYRVDDGSSKKALDFVHPGDLQTAQELFQKSMSSPGEPIRNQFRVRHKDGYYIWIEGTVMNLLQNENVKAFIVNYRDITHRKKAENQIHELNESLEQKVIDRTAQLQEANKALEAFSYSVSHDLRAPARAITGFAQIIDTEYSADFSPELNELFAHIMNMGKRMTAIIEDLLSLAKYEKVMPQQSIVDMDKLFREVWDKLGIYGNGHHAALKMDVLPPAVVDASLVEQVVVNLLSNAIKYSSKKENPTVTVGFEQGDDTITYMVKDNGAGFDMKNYNRLFGAFQRLHGSSEFEGTGVGLLLVKRIIEKHGGVVRAEGAVNEGATFYFTLPAINAG